MRIVVFADHAIAEGGAPQVAISSALGLAALGHAVTYVQGVGQAGDPKLDSHPLVERISLDGRDIWSKGLLTAARDGVWNSAHRASIQAILARFDPADTVVHVHQWTKFFSPSVFSYILDSGLPLVVSLHDYFVSCPTGLMYRFDRQEPCSARPLSTDCLVASCDPRSPLHKAIRVLRTLAVKRVMDSRPFTAIHVSETSRRTLASHLPSSVRQVVLENPVLSEDRGIRAAGSARKIAFCGRLTLEKGADLVALAAREAGVASLFVGDGPLRERILAIDPTAEVTGWLDRSAVRERIARDAIAVVAPSRWAETGPLVIAEAMASGVPVIVSDRAGAAGRVRHGGNGLVVTPDVASIARAITELRKPGIAREMGKAAYRDFWAAPPSIQHHARQLIGIYGEALRAAPARPRRLSA